MKNQLLVDWTDIQMTLSRLRKEQGLTLEALGDKLGVSSQAANQHESKRNLPRLNTLYAWAEVLGYELKISLVKRDAK